MYKHIKGCCRNIIIVLTNITKHSDTWCQGLTCHIQREQGQVTLTSRPLIHALSKSNPNSFESQSLISYLSKRVQWSDVPGFKSYLCGICQHKFPFKRPPCLCGPTRPCRQWERLCSPWLWPLWVSVILFLKKIYIYFFDRCVKT